MLKLSWDDIEALSAELADAVVNARGPVDPQATLLGVSRGGLIPATLVAHRLGVRKVEALGLMSYEDGPDGTQGALVEYGEAPRVASIIIDDIIDTGRTLEALRARYPDAIIAALVDKTDGRSGAIAARRTPAGLWVAFPWEAD